MRQRLTITVMVLSAAWPFAARGDDGKNLSDIHKKAAGALAVVRCTYAADVGDRTITGLGICIDRDAGVFMTLVLDPGMPQGSFKDFHLVLPGAAAKTMKAELLGIDPQTGISFVRAAEKRAWSVVKFSAQSDLKVGQEVASVGTLNANLGHATCLGLGRVSSVVRVPDRLVYVSGGKLTCIGSPVFALDGRAVGIVGQKQLFLSFQTATARGVVPLALKGLQETSFFTPVEEFVHVLTRIPSPGRQRRLPWMGVLRFDGVGKSLAELAGLDAPAVMIEQIVPAGPAAKAGLKERDIIIEIDGRPLERLATVNLIAHNFVQKLQRMPVGKTITLTIVRDKKILKPMVQLVRMPQMPNEAKRHFCIALGMGVREKVPMDQFLDKGPTAKVPGMVVIQLQRKGPAQKAGVKIGDLLTGIDKQHVTTVAEVKRIVERVVADKAKGTVVLLVRRGEKAFTIAVQPRR